MSVCSDMLEVILGPINLIPHVAAVTTDDLKSGDLNCQSEVAIACDAMSCSLENATGGKDQKSSTIIGNLCKITLVYSEIDQ